MVPAAQQPPVISLVDEKQVATRKPSALTQPLDSSASPVALKPAEPVETDPIVSFANAFEMPDER